MRVLLVEDDARLSRVIVRVLQQERYDVDAAYDGNTGLDLALVGEYDVAIIDRMLPGMNGIDLIRGLREEKIDTPVLMLTAMSELPERVQGLDAGADDYLGKPFAFDELLARLRALRRRSGRPLTGETIAVGQLSINLDSHEVRVGETSIELTPQEYRLLEVLARNSGRIMSRDQLLERVWGPDADPTGNVVDLYIFYLRKKLKLESGVSADSTIQTVRGAGYVLRAGA